MLRVGRFILQPARHMAREAHLGERFFENCFQFEGQCSAVNRRGRFSGLPHQCLALYEAALY